MSIIAGALNALKLIGGGTAVIAGYQKSRELLHDVIAGPDKDYSPGVGEKLIDVLDPAGFFHENSDAKVARIRAQKDRRKAAREKRALERSLKKTAKTAKAQGAANERAIAELKARLDAAEKANATAKAPVRALGKKWNRVGHAMLGIAAKAVPGSAEQSKALVAASLASAQAAEPATPAQAAAVARSRGVVDPATIRLVQDTIAKVQNLASEAQAADLARDLISAPDDAELVDEEEDDILSEAEEEEDDDEDVLEGPEFSSLGAVEKERARRLKACAKKVGALKLVPGKFGRRVPDPRGLVRMGECQKGVQRWYAQARADLDKHYAVSTEQNRAARDRDVASARAQAERARADAARARADAASQDAAAQERAQLQAQLAEQAAELAASAATADAAAQQNELMAQSMQFSFWAQNPELAAMQQDPNLGLAFAALRAGTGTGSTADDDDMFDLLDEEAVEGHDPTGACCDECSATVAGADDDDDDLFAGVEDLDDEDLAGDDEDDDEDLAGGEECSTGMCGVPRR